MYSLNKINHFYVLYIILLILIYYLYSNNKFVYIIRNKRIKIVINYINIKNDFNLILYLYTIIVLYAVA